MRVIQTVIVVAQLMNIVKNTLWDQIIIMAVRLIQTWIPTGINASSSCFISCCMLLT